MIGLRKIKNTIIFIVTVAILTMFCSCCKHSEIKLATKVVYIINLLTLSVILMKTSQI
jgi:hypothetical protein